MNTELAFALGELHRNNEQSVFDWNKAAKLIKENHIQNAYAGLAGDLEWTSAIILLDGKPYNSDDDAGYLASTWAMPVLVNEDTGEVIPCYVMKHETEWDALTRWPESALAILNKENRS